MSLRARPATIVGFLLLASTPGLPAQQQRNRDNLPPRKTQKPPLHGTHWVAVTGKPLGATAGAMILGDAERRVDPGGDRRTHRHWPEPAMMNSFQDHSSQPGGMLVASSTSLAVRAALAKMGYRLQFAQRTSGPITAIWFDHTHGTFWGAASNHGEDTGIAW